MISLERRDARKELGLGFGGGRDMEDTELEEGEACSYRNDNDGVYDSSMDPDIDLSYIGEKLQHVLGHFQKDFEGGVSAENLGAKFGGYGSFLPTYQRSPVWSRPRTPPNNQHNNASKSPTNFQMEGGAVSYLCSSMAPQSTKSETASTNALLQPVTKESSSLRDSGKKESSIPSTHKANAIAKTYEPRNNKPANLLDQKKLRVRIKVGSDNLSTQNNAAIYSGLGLDVSPSSSLDVSSSDTEGMSHEPQDNSFESPAQILWIMTSFPLHGSQLLSPLPDYLLRMIEKEELPKDKRQLSSSRLALESSGIGMNGSDTLKGHGRALGAKRIKSLNISEVSSGKNGMDSRCSSDTIPNKERDLDTLACEELVTNTLKLPLLSSSCGDVADATKGTGNAFNSSKELYKGGLRDKSSSEETREETLEPAILEEDGCFENQNTTVIGKGRAAKKHNSSDSVSLNTRIDDHCLGEKINASAKVDSNTSKRRNDLTSEAKDCFKQKAKGKAKSLVHEMKSHSGKESSSSEGEKRMEKNESPDNIVLGMQKESLEFSLSLVSKSKKNFDLYNHITKGELGDLKSIKNTEKAGDMYREFFGDIDIQQEQSLVSTPEESQLDRIKDSNVLDRSMHGTQILKERSSGKKIMKQALPETYPEAAPNIALRSGNGPISDVPHATTAPVLIQENWVCCDKCQTWRLLPIGKNPNDLPEKWVCSMLNWLPRMNRCSLSEEETTNALIALYQVPPPESKSNQKNNLGLVASKETITETHPGHIHTNIANGAKENNSLKESSNPVNRDGLSHLVKKNIQASVASVRSIEVSKSPLVSETDLIVDKSSDLVMENHSHKQKEKNKVLDYDGATGDTKRLKMKGKRDHSQDSFRASKKIRTEGFVEESQLGVATDKVGQNLSNGLPSTSLEKPFSKYNKRKDAKYCRTDQVQVSGKRVRDTDETACDDFQNDIVACDIKYSSERRKMKEIHSQLQDSRILAKDFSENDQRKEKARVSGSHGKDSSASKSSGKTIKKGSNGKTKQLSQETGNISSHQILDGGESSRRDSTLMHPAPATTSSSSKVSGSHKTKVNVHDVKGSPVESVSSLPMKSSKLDNITPARKSQIEKEDDSVNAGFSAEGGLRRCSDVDDGGNCQSGTVRKEKTEDVAHQGSLESSIVDFHLMDASGVQANVLTDCDGPNTRYQSKSASLDQLYDNERQNETKFHSSGSHPRKSGKGISSQTRDKNRISNPELVNHKIKPSDSVDGQALSHEVRPIGKNQIAEKSGIKSDEDENVCIDTKSSAGLLIIDNSNNNKDGRYFGGSNVPDIKVNTTCSYDADSTTKQSMQPDCEMVSGRGKALTSAPSGDQSETLTDSHRLVSGPQKGHGENGLCDNDLADGYAAKMPKDIKKVDYPNGIPHNSSRNSMSNGCRGRDLEGPSTVKRDSSSQAAKSAVKEAKNLKHMADRVKNSGSHRESMRLYFEAALKFLHGAALFESCGIENAKTAEMIQSMQIYSTTAKLCEFCAHEYEKLEDMAAAALAYKCAEVAYMRVVCSLYTNANRDRLELHAALQKIPPGESPSSSASDIDNLNHTTSVDKVPLAKGVASPLVNGNHIITAKNRTSIVRLLNFSQEVSSAMEASRKSRIAFAAANSKLGEAQGGDVISSIRTAYDFSFQDVEGFLRLVRLAFEAIDR
ncbi:hypothetical protein K2173_026319 [Erythroxylum novogranatense]|uniref:CW-type domain-containing protein n=1 Tax=Erythroxylum novogranatense TaxID=1862640 RepID=A0AAV8SCH2_9ROSI|nr:hypothetical protein K2173_026319 [Erythroxylum novogranatense]